MSSPDTGPTLPTRSYDAFLFDMDGTLLSSIAAAERVWTAWGRRHGLDLATFIPTIHGVRAPDTIRNQNLPGIDLEAEAAWVTAGEIADTDGVEEIPGAIAFLASLPPDRWAVVTSATPDLAKARMGAAGIAPPPLVITAHDIQRGKPDPEGFRLAAERLGFAIEDCLVFEDATAGITAAEAAPADIVVITAAHQHPLETPHPTLDGYEGVRCVVGADGRLSLTL
ncbi:HAD-IA family hydrolase [Brevundimonas goettingensis]|uniref:HAD-IA family hydrolase n=1 Tax=Brevundimonas goettingensis TaxID=2774190 RepID=A0A975C398_9CAUL|nr:HAD-IA family hydrolase [Brevundimonas goettingensis]QTC90531.1 HAD-IA family hydrolase [Brevundimonas goettingensis]